MARCISGDSLCSEWYPCRLCRERAEHQRRLAEIRRDIDLVEAEGDLARAERRAAARRSEERAEFISEHPGSIAAALAALAAVSGVQAVIDYNRRLSRKYGSRK